MVGALGTKPELIPLREKIVQAAMADFDKVKDHAARNPLQDRLEAQSLTLMGDIYLATNRLKESLQQYDRASAILDRFARDFPDDSVGPRNLAAITNKRAEVLIRLGDAAQARDLYRQALALRERWALMEPNHLPARQAIAITRNNLGNVNLLLGDPETAQTHFEAMLKTYRGLPEEVTRTPAIRREIALGEAMVAEALLKQGKRTEAEQGHREASKLRADLLKLGPNNRTLIRDVAASHLYLGDLFQTSAGDPVAAWPEYAQTLKDFTRLQKADPDGVGPRRDLALILYRVGVTAQRLEAAGKTDAVQPPPASSQSYFEQCREIREGLAKLDPNDTTARIDWMLALARCGQTAEAEKLARGLVEQAQGDTRLLFQAACGLATASETANAESAPNLRDQAFKVLNDLIAHGWKDRAALETDPDLEGVRPDPRFAPLLEGLPPAAPRP